MQQDDQMIDWIIAFESGELNDEHTLDLFSYLIRTGQAWTLQGFYGRTAQGLIEAGYLDESGRKLRVPDDEEGY